MAFYYPEEKLEESTTEFPIDSKILTVEAERALKYRDKFYKYSGIKPGTKLTKEDVEKHWWNGFKRIACIENCTEEELLEDLLSDKWNK